MEKTLKIDLVIPTFQRINKLERLLTSIPKDNDVKIWLYFDNNDLEGYKHFKGRGYNCMYMNKKYQAIGIWNYHLERYFNADIFCYLCDDTTFYPNTIDKIKEIFNSKFSDFDGVLGLHQANMKGTDSAMGCVGKNFIKRYPKNKIYCPDYMSFYFDTELGDYAKELDKFYYSEDCKINHYHCGIFKEEMDKTHSVIRGEDKNIDIRMNKARKEKGLLWGKTFELIGRENV